MRRRSLKGLGLLAFLLLASVSKCLAQNLPVYPLADQQKKFCQAHQEMAVQFNQEYDKLKYDGLSIAPNRAIYEYMQEHHPEIPAAFSAKIFRLMGTGEFKDWVGRVTIRLDSNRVFLTIEFPCVIENAHDGSPNRVASEWMAIGNEWRSAIPRPSIRGFAMDAPIVKVIATLHNGELVAVSGKLFCDKTGCMNNDPRDLEFTARILEIRSLKGAK
jgi:hypothetical protein